MNSTGDDYIIIEKSSDDPEKEGGEAELKEGEEISLKTLNEQGIFPVTEKQIQDSEKAIRNFPQDLLEEGGIEIIPNEEGEGDAFL